MEHQLATQPMQKEQTTKAPSSSPLQSNVEGRVTTHPMLRLQRAVGNQAVQRMVRERQLDGQVQQSSPHVKSAAAIPTSVHKVLSSSGQPLAPTTRSFMEPRFGQDFSQVRIHADGEAATAARDVNATAYIVGQDIVFDSGQFQPETDAGKRLLAHELAHVVQQSRGGNFAPPPLPTHPLEQAAQYSASEPLEPQDENSMVGLNSEQRKSNNTQFPDQGVQSSNVLNQPAELVKQGTQKERVTTSPENSSQPAGTSNTILSITASNAPPQSTSTITTNSATAPAPLSASVSMTSPVSSSPQQSIPTSTMAGAAVSPSQTNISSAIVSPVASPASAATATTQSVGLQPPQTDNRQKLEASNRDPVLFPSSTAEAKAKPVDQGKSEEDSHPQPAKTNDIQSPIRASAVTTKSKSKSKGSDTLKSQPEGKVSAPVKETAPSKAGVTGKSVDAEEAQAPEPVSESLNEELNNFVLQVKSKREELSAEAGQKKERVRSAADEEKKNITQIIESQIQKVDDTYNEAMRRIEISSENARGAIFAQRDTKIEDTNQNAREESDNLDKLFAQKADALRKVAEEKAKAATDGGQKQADRAREGSKEKSARALSIGEKKVEQYKHYNRANGIASVARDLAADLADKITSAGDELVATAQNDANDLANKFRNEAEDAIDKFADKKQEFQDKIEQQRVKTVEGLNQMATDSVSQLESSAQNTLAELEKERQAIAQQIRDLVPAGMMSIDQVADAACTKVDQQTTQAVEQLVNFVASVQEMLGQARGETAERHLQDAQTQIDIALAIYETDMNIFIDNSTQTIQTVSSEFYHQVSEQANQFVEPVKQSTTDFEAKAEKTANDVKVAMDNAVAENAKAMHGIVTDAEKPFQEAIDQSEQEWAKELAQGLDQIKNKVDVGLTKYDEALANLGSKIDEQAEKIEHASAIERIWDWVVGIIEGFFGALWEFVKIVLKVLLIALAILLVIGIIVALVAGIAAAIEVIAAIVAAIAIVLEAIGEFLLIIGIILAVFAAAYMIYLAVTRDDLSDEARGKLVGKAIFEIVLAIFGEKIAGKLGEWFQSMARFRRLEEIVGDEALLASLLEAVKGDEVLLEELLKLTSNNAERLEQLLDKVGNAKRLRSLLGRADSASQLGKFLDETNDLAQLDKLLDLTDNASQLERLLKLTNGNASQLENFLELAGGKGSGAKLEELINLAIGKDPARVEDLLRIINGNASQLDELLNAAKQFRQQPVGATPMPSNLAAPPTNPGAASFSGAGMRHFLERHTYEFFDFSDIKREQSFWPPGTTPQEIANFLEDAIEVLRGNRSTVVVAPGIPVQLILPNGFVVQIGTRLASGGEFIGQFFPVSGPGVIKLLELAMRAIKKVIVP